MLDLPWATRAAAALIRGLARQYPQPERAAVRRDEWLAQLDELRGPSARLWFALSCAGPVLKAQPSLIMLLIDLIVGSFLLAGRLIVVFLLPQLVVILVQQLTTGHLGYALALLAPVAFCLGAFPRHEGDFSWMPRWSYSPRMALWLSGLMVTGLVSGLAAGPPLVQLSSGVLIALLLWKVAIAVHVTRRARRL